MGLGSIWGLLATSLAPGSVRDRLQGVGQQVTAGHQLCSHVLE